MQELVQGLRGEWVACTMAVCEEGMPPEPTMRVGSHRFSVYQKVNSFVI